MHDQLILQRFSEDQIKRFVVIIQSMLSMKHSDEDICAVMAINQDILNAVKQHPLYEQCLFDNVVDTKELVKHVLMPQLTGITQVVAGAALEGDIRACELAMKMAGVFDKKEERQESSADKWAVLLDELGVTSKQEQIDEKARETIEADFEVIEDRSDDVSDAVEDE